MGDKLSVNGIYSYRIIMYTSFHIQTPISMSLKKYVEIYFQLENLIRFEQTGSPQELSSKLNVSERQVFNYIRDLKELGLQIKFSQEKNTYLFVN
jgi:hypothetical protein